MNFWRYIFAPLYRVWFYLAVFITIVLLFPFIFVASLRPAYHRQFSYFARLWGRMILTLCGFSWRVQWDEKPKRGEQYIICANHTSMVDIMLTQAIFPFPFLFIGKKELVRLPIFGYFYKRTNILVDRKSLSSRKLTYDLSAQALREGKSLCIYPEGMAPREDILLAPFKMGAFRLAAETGATIIPATFFDSKRLLPYDNFRGGPGRLRVKVQPFLRPRNSSALEAKRLKDECYALILQALENPQVYAP